MLVVCGFFCDSVLSEMHIKSSLILSSLKKFFRSSIWADNEEILRCKTDKPFWFYVNLVQFIWNIAVTAY